MAGAIRRRERAACEARRILRRQIRKAQHRLAGSGFPEALARVGLR
jgi:hypothetical protein